MEKFDTSSDCFGNSSIGGRKSIDAQLVARGFESGLHSHGPGEGARRAASRHASRAQERDAADRHGDWPFRVGAQREARRLKIGRLLL